MCLLISLLPRSLRCVEASLVSFPHDQQIDLLNHNPQKHAFQAMLHTQQHQIPLQWMARPHISMSFGAGHGISVAATQDVKHTHGRLEQGYLYLESETKLADHILHWHAQHAREFLHRLLHVDTFSYPEQRTVPHLCQLTACSTYVLL